MITRSRLDFSRIARHLGRNLVFLLVYDTAITVVYVMGWHQVGINELPLPLLGSAIAIIVTFRNNASYNRWWEARTLWGQVVNSSRSLGRGLIALSDDASLLERLTRYQIAYVLALRCSLLGIPHERAVAPYVPCDMATGIGAHANVPTAIQNAMAADLATSRRSGKLDAISLSSLECTLSALANCQGALERIKRTPLARQYTQFPQVFVGLYCLLLPIGLVHGLGLLTPIGSTLVGFMFLALDRIGQDLQDPFHGTVHDIPMQAITRTIEIDLLEAIGGHPVPDRIREQEGVLW
jgi:putative membrane protein